MLSVARTDWWPVQCFAACETTLTIDDVLTHQGYVSRLIDLIAVNSSGVHVLTSLEFHVQNFSSQRKK